MNHKMKTIRFLIAYVLFTAVFIFAFSVLNAQQGLPEPGPQRKVNIPLAQHKTLPNGLRVYVIQKNATPLVTVTLLNTAANSRIESAGNEGLANFTAGMLTKGTTKRSAETIAEMTEFLGADLAAFAGWNSTRVRVSVTSDKLSDAMEIFSDVVLNPNFPESEFDLLKSQTLDNTKYNLTQPGFLTNYAASVFSFKEHPEDGTPESINALKISQIKEFYKEYYQPKNSFLIFVGDITEQRALQLASKYFGSWKNKTTAADSKPAVFNRQKGAEDSGNFTAKAENPRRILILDLPNSGQASVAYSAKLNVSRVTKSSNGKSVVNPDYYKAVVMNSILGGGYSSRLNSEIRIKRGLSYGAGSSISWRFDSSNFIARAQTKTVSAAEVAQLMLAEIAKMISREVAETELVPRKSSVIGGFSRNLETTDSLSNGVADLLQFNLEPDVLAQFIANVDNVKAKDILSISALINQGDLIIAGDYSQFREDLSKRFPDIKPLIIKASELDLSKLR
ncbi:MAG TPA: pitrilysin family protein [Pyrinomonadaceae bacterium]|nr:pitrilysin family protein [Pyrinomonadaceae bacterium]